MANADKDHLIKRFVKLCERENEKHASYDASLSLGGSSFDNKRNNDCYNLAYGAVSGFIQAVECMDMSAFAFRNDNDYIVGVEVDGIRYPVTVASYYKEGAA